VLQATISGPPGSGTSTLVEGICKNRNWSSLNGGEVFREQAKERGLTVESFSELCREDLDVDRLLDEQLKLGMADMNGPAIIESRLAAWWARIHISTSIEERAKRLMKRDGGTYSENFQRATNRHSDDQHRYQSLYGISLDDMTPYTHVIEADDLDESKVLSMVLKILEG
jgi:cytidylate kinase